MILHPAITALIVSAALISVYSFTILPGLGWEDTAEMALAVDCLGIPHSPGFPLFVLLGRVVHILATDTAARAASTLSALSICGAAGLLAGFLAKRHSIAMGLLAGMSLGLSPPVWQQACRGEVYGFHLLLSTIIVLTSIGLGSPGDGSLSGRRTRSAMLSGYVFGLGLITHPSILGLSPLLGGFLKRMRTSQALFLGLLLSLTVILFLPIRSMNDPFLDWGKTSTFEGFVWLVSLQEFANN